MPHLSLLLFFPYRDSVMEILFEQDNEEKSVATLILDTLIKVQIKYETYTMDTIWFLIILLESFSVFGRRNARTRKRLITQFDVMWLPWQHGPTVLFCFSIGNHLSKALPN